MNLKLIIMLASVAVFFLVLGILSYAARSVVSERLSKISNHRKIREVAIDTARAVGKTMQRWSLIKDLVRPDLLEAKLQTARLKISVAEFIGIWSISTIGAFIIAMIVRGIFPAFFIPFIVMVGFALPKAYLDRQYRKNRILLRRQFIDFLERVQVGFSGGVGFYRVLDWASKTNSLLAEGIKRILEDINLGSTTGDALDGFSRRMDDIEIDNFVTTVKHALRNGLTYTSALSSLLVDIRRRRDARIDEVSRKAETKLILPVVLTVLPATAFLVIGPMIVYYTRMFFI